MLLYRSVRAFCSSRLSSLEFPHKIYYSQESDDAVIEILKTITLLKGKEVAKLNSDDDFGLLEFEFPEPMAGVVQLTIRADDNYQTSAGLMSTNESLLKEIVKQVPFKGEETSPWKKE